jgi:hypothetical protein
MGEIARLTRLTNHLPSARLRSGPILVFGMALAGCGSAAMTATDSPPPNPITSVVPSATGTPNSVTSFGGYEFVSVQGAGLIATYAATGSSQKLTASYATPCMDPSGMVATTIGGVNVLAAVCFDAGTIVTLTIAADGSLHALGVVYGLSEPYPEIALDGTNLYVPLFGGGAANGTVAQISLAKPAAPVISGTVTLASPVAGQHVNAVSLAASGGYVYVASGSESQPLNSSSSVQVINESTMALTGSPLVVPHSPQQIVVSGGVAYVTLFDEFAIEAIDISNPAAIKSIATASLPNCHPIPVTVSNNVAYIGCYGEGTIARLNVANPAQIGTMTTISGIPSPEDLAVSGNSLLVTDASPGGALYSINLSEL